MRQSYASLHVARPTRQALYHWLHQETRELHIMAPSIHGHVYLLNSEVVLYLRIHLFRPRLHVLR